MKKVHLKINGKTTTDRIVIGNIFEFVDTLGLPLSIIYDKLAEKNMVIDWKEFVTKALGAKWNSDTVKSRCLDSMRYHYEKKTFNKFWSELGFD